MAALAFKQEWPGFDRDGMYKTPFPPLNHDKMPSGVSRSELQLLNINIPPGAFNEKDGKEETKLERAGELIGSWLVRCKLLVLPQALLQNVAVLNEH